MGLTWYYHIFIEFVSKIAYPITTLQKKSVWFIWNQQCQDSFEKLKQLLTTTPVLKIVDPSKDFVVCTDASKKGVGGVLTQEGYIISYESLKLKEHEENYVVHDLELVSIMNALKMRRHYLIGKKFMLWIDNIGLNTYLIKKTLNACQARWLAFLSGYNF